MRGDGQRDSGEQHWVEEAWKLRAAGPVAGLAGMSLGLALRMQAQTHELLLPQHPKPEHPHGHLERLRATGRQAQYEQ